MRNPDRRHRRHGKGPHGGHGPHGGGPHGAPHRAFHPQRHGPPRRDAKPAPSRPTPEELYQGKTAIAPREWIRLEAGLPDPSMRAVDLLAPVGKGQRGLIVSPPKAGKTTLLRQICQAAHGAQPGLKIYCLLVDERPEEVTEFRRGVPAEVVASSSDRPNDEHIRVAGDLLERAAREAASGQDVFVLLDSLTRLARAHNRATPSTRTMTGGLDARAMETPRRFFGAARCLEEGGSLTILATILVDTGSKMDDIIFQEFKGTGNMELVLSRQAAEQRLFPALNVRQTGTRREELLLPADVLEGVWKLRRALASMGDLEATRALVELLRKHPNNGALLASLR